jgi:hypothetical protein
MKKGHIGDILIILVLIVLVYMLFQVTGGNLLGALSTGNSGGTGTSPLDGLVNGLKGVGEGIGGVFGRLRP